MIHIHNKRSKYGNKKVEIDGHKFDSKKEANHYLHLKMLEKAGEITGLKLQPKFSIMVNGEKICTYIADFEYWKNFDGGQERKIIDVKGIRTAVYRLKKKLVFATYGIEIIEV